MLVNIIIWIIGILTKSPRRASALTNPINSLVFALTLVFYLVSIYKLRQAQRGNNVSRETRSLTQMASIYIVTYFLVNLPIISFRLLRRDVEELWYASVIQFATLLIMNLNAIFNAVAFLIKNRECRRSMAEKFRSWRNFIFRRRPQIDAVPAEPAEPAAENNPPNN